MLERIPCNIEAEESILGAMLYSHAAIPSAQALLVPEDFYHEGHRVIYRALLELYAEGKPTDHTVLVDRLKKSGQLDMVGDRAYLLSLEDTCPNPNNAKHYASLVKEAALRRQWPRPWESACIRCLRSRQPNSIPLLSDSPGKRIHRCPYFMERCENRGSSSQGSNLPRQK